MVMDRARVLRLFAGAIAIAVVGLVAAVATTWPALAAVVCPSCYGFDRLNDRLLVDAEMPADQRQALLSSIDQAQVSVAAFFGSLDRRPTILACATDHCDKRIGGRGARAITYSFPGGSVLRLSPRGLDRTIVAHEFTHVQVHAKVGVLNQMQGAVPAWFDEGLAVLVSDDARYLNPGASAVVRCMRTTTDVLPVSPFQWGPLAGKSPMIYADAACRVLHWMEANGGKAGLLAALDDVARGRRQLP